jgi:hypothetical protein
MGEAAQDSPRIVFGGLEQKDNRETVRNDDFLLVDPDLFTNVFQTDADLCAYLALAAQLLLSNQENNLAKKSLADIKDRNAELHILAKNLQRMENTARLSNWQTRRVLKNTTPNVNKIIRFLDYAKPNEEVGPAVIRMIRDDGLLPAIYLQNEDHAVLVIGVSTQGRKELIAWDALSGKGNPRLRRIPVDREDLGFMSAVEVHSLFKPKQETGE